MQAALAPRLCSPGGAPLGRRQALTAGQRPWTASRSHQAAGLGLRAAAEGQASRKDRHRFVADTESEEEVDPDSDIPMSQRLTARDTYREMANMPPEYPPEPEPYNPDKHRTVDDMVSDANEMLPDDPVDLDEEIITDTKPFIQDLYNETAGVKRKAPPRSASSAASNVDAPGHSTGAVGNRPTKGGTAMSVGGLWMGPVGNLPRDGATFMSASPDDREQRKAEAEEQATDMKHGTGQKESSEGPEDGSSGGTESEHIVPEGGTAASKGGSAQRSDGIGDKPQPVSGAVAVRGAAKAQAAARAAAAKSLHQEGFGLSEGGPGMADRVVAQAAAEGMEGREEAGSEKGPAATGGGGATSRTTNAQDVGGASGAAGGVEKEAAAQGKEEDEDELLGWGGSGTKEDRRARRRALEQMGGDRPERAGLTLYLDKEQRQ